MLNALFWYTGLIVWIVIVIGWLSMLCIGIRDKAILRRRDIIKRSTISGAPTSR
jgi:hypothetical protein